MRANATDEIYIAAPRQTVARRLLDLSTDASWWPGARCTGEYGRVIVNAPTGRLNTRVRFEAGIGPVREWDGFTWFLEKGELAGRAEWWLEEFKDGTIVHHYLDADRGDTGRWRRLPTVVRRYRWAVRGALNALKDDLELRQNGR